MNPRYQSFATANRAQAPSQPLPPPVAPPVPTAPQPPQQPDPLVPNFTPTDTIYDEQPSKKRRLLPILVLLIALALIGGFAASALGVFSSFSNVTYDNNNGSSYKLDFYREYKVQKLSTNLAPTYAANIDKLADGTKKLVSNKSKGDKSPLTIAIWKANKSSAALGFKNCPAAAPRALKVHDEKTNSDVNLCAVRDAGKDVVYLGILPDGNTSHVITIIQDLPFDDVNDEKTAQALIAKTDLGAYRDDITKIVASIDPQ